MAHLTESRVGETTTYTGTLGVVSVSAALTAHRRFSDVAATSDTFWYDIAAIDANGAETGDWQEGLGTYSAANQVTLTTCAYSSNANSAVDFAAGTKYIRIVAYPNQIRAVPRGGSSGQALTKSSASDYATQWISLPSFADLEVPSGTIDGANAAFSLAHSPSPAASLLLFRNGVAQRAGGVDYTLAGSTVTYAVAPSTGDTHVAWYRY